MQKISVSADKKHRKGVLETLQRLGVMQIEANEIEADGLEKMDTRNASETYDRNADMLDEALKLLLSYSGKKKGGGLFSELKEVSQSQYDQVISARHTLLKKASVILQSEKEIQDSKAAILKDEDRIISLGPWMNLDVPMNLRGTGSTRLLIGTLPGLLTEAEIIQAAAKDMDDPVPLDVNILSAETNLTYVSVLCLHRQRDQVLENLRAAGFVRPASVEEMSPKDAKAAAEADIEKQKQDIEKRKARIAGFADDSDDFEIAIDYYRSRAEKYRLLSTIPQTENVFFLEGWVDKSKADAVLNMLRDKFDAVAEKEEPAEGEMAPTLLKNNKFSEAAEGVLESYGLPTPDRADPTFVMSIFYVIFFGMMLSDAGYGLIMAVACAVILKKKPKLGDGLKKMLKLFFWCGLSTIVWGFLYGGFFGDAIDVIAKTFFGYTGDPILKPLWFAPLDDPMRLLIYSLLFGLIHLFAGLGVKGYEYLRDKDVVGFLSDVVAWYCFVGGLVLILVPSDIFASIAGTKIVFPDWLNLAAKIMTIVGVAVILLMSGRTNKNWGLRIALGAYDIYGVMNWLSDALSYSRLLALGLATGVIANVINMMCSMVGGGVIGVIVFLTLFPAGHILNLGINALGAYVHTNRLQYVEFFGKFYDAGGRAFKPFKSINKYTNVTSKEE